MMLSLWLGLVLSGGQLGDETLRRFPEPIDAARAPLPGLEVLPRTRETNHYSIPKVPPPGVAASYSSVPMSRPYLALTFDDGPHVTNTPRLLKILEERNVKATFYVVGRNVREYPALLRRMVAEGHEIGNHSWDHPPLSSLGPDKIRLQLHKTHDAVLKAAGYQMRTMRPPYGATNLRVRQICLQDFGYPAIIWSVDPLDWKQPGAEEVERLIIQGAHPGAIILVHDIHAATVDAMPKAIDELLARGYHFVTVSQLLNLGYKYPPPAPMPEHVPVAIPVEEAAEALPVENLPLAPLRPPVDLPLPGVGTPAPAAGGN